MKYFSIERLYWNCAVIFNFSLNIGAICVSKFGFPLLKKKKNNTHTQTLAHILNMVQQHFDAMDDNIFSGPLAVSFNFVFILYCDVYWLTFSLNLVSTRIDNNYTNHYEPQFRMLKVSH